MKKIQRIGLGLLALVAISWVAFAATQVIGRNLVVTDNTSGTAITIKKPTSTTATFLEAYAGSVLKFQVPSTGVLPITYGGTGGATAKAALANLGVRCGTVTMAADGTVTNVWNPVFTVAPIVVLTPVDLVPQGSNNVRVVSANVASNVFFGHPAAVYNYVAVQPAP